MPWLRLLVAGLSTPRPGFAPRWVHLGLVVDTMTMGKVFYAFFGFPLSISFHCGSPYWYINWMMNKRPVCGHSSETYMNNNNLFTAINYRFLNVRIERNMWHIMWYIRSAKTNESSAVFPFPRKHFYNGQFTFIKWRTNFETELKSLVIVRVLTS
jgi:hypothetical protein